MKRKENHITQLCIIYNSPRLRNFTEFHLSRVQGESNICKKDIYA